MLQANKKHDQPKVDVNLAAAVQFGIKVEKHWRHVERTEEQAIVIEEGEKQVIRENIMQCIYQTTNSQIMKQFVRSLKTIIK